MITKDILDAIESRAAMLANTFYFLEREDLRQDGIELVLRLEQKRKAEKYMLKAINNLYSNVLDRAISRNKCEINTSAFEYDPDILDTNDSSEDITTEREITKKLLQALSGRDKVLIELLTAGLTLEDISRQLGITRHELRKRINNIIQKRKEVEK